MSKITIYADGACEPNPGEGGWACVLFTDKREVRKSGYVESSTNQRMEITAVIEALKLMGKSYNVELYTDSMYVINCATNWLDGWLERGEQKANMDLWLEFKELADKHNINFHHVKGHTGDVNNELCDTLAVRAIKNKKGYYEINDF